MSYGMAGRNFHGDPFLGGILKTVIGGGISLGKKIFGKKKLPFPALPRGFPQFPGIPSQPGIGTPFRPGLPHLPPGHPDTAMVPKGTTGFGPAKRKRINPANPKALRRTIRRQDGFVKLARRALKGSGYTIVSRGSRRPKRDLGAGHTHVR